MACYLRWTTAETSVTFRAVEENTIWKLQSDMEKYFHSILSQPYRKCSDDFIYYVWLPQSLVENYTGIILPLYLLCSPSSPCSLHRNQMAFNGNCLLLLAGPLFSALELISPMSCDSRCRGQLDLCLFYEQCPSCIKTKNAGASAKLCACVYLVSVELKAQMGDIL